jgi:anti-anti-sigma factor
MKLHLVASQPGLTRLQAEDEITLLDFQGHANPLDDYLGPSGYSGIVLLGLAGSSYIDSSGVGWLIQCHAAFQKAGGLLILHSIAPMVNHCFRVLGIYGLLHVVENEDAALKLAEASLPQTV